MRTNASEWIASLETHIRFTHIRKWLSVAVSTSVGTCVTAKHGQRGSVSFVSLKTKGKEEHGLMPWTEISGRQMNTLGSALIILLRDGTETTRATKTMPRLYFPTKRSGQKMILIENRDDLTEKRSGYQWINDVYEHIIPHNYINRPVVAALQCNGIKYWSG